uniref:CACTA en-spm transposon protein n=1 Tax=Panagrellus redivivus TaxID=6233 RepID=A0A7E4V0F3_PANRE
MKRRQRHHDCFGAQNKHVSCKDRHVVQSYCTLFNLRHVSRTAVFFQEYALPVELPVQSAKGYLVVFSTLKRRNFRQSDHITATKKKKMITVMWAVDRYTAHKYFWVQIPQDGFCRLEDSEGAESGFHV